jgi:hypothetical protein
MEQGGQIFNSWKSTYLFWCNNATGSQKAAIPSRCVVAPKEVTQYHRNGNLRPLLYNEYHSLWSRGVRFPCDARVFTSFSATRHRKTNSDWWQIDDGKKGHRPPENGRFGPTQQSTAKETIRITPPRYLGSFVALLIVVLLLKSPILVEMAPNGPADPGVIDFGVKMANFWTKKLD